jgi:hypothetical protein
MHFKVDPLKRHIPPVVRTSLTKLQPQQIATVLIALPALALACAQYHYCLCGNADGSFDDTATGNVCVGDGYALMTFTDGRKYCETTKGSAFGIEFDNCSWRERCQAQGATGDSNCWDKD